MPICLRSSRPRSPSLSSGTNAKLALQFDSRLWRTRGPWGRSNGSTFADTGYQNTCEVTRVTWRESRMRPSSRRCGRVALALLAAWASACATRLDVARVTPTYSGGAIRSVALGVTDHRPFVVDGHKQEWFEGTVWGAFGIPTSIGRGLVTSGQHGTPYPQFATRLAHLLESGLVAGGATGVAVVPLPVAMVESECLAQLAASGTERRLLVVMNQSRFDFGGFYRHPDYDYDFEAVVADPAGSVLARRRFAAHEADLTADGSLNFYDNADLLMYRPTLSTILSDPEILAAIRR